MTSLLPIWKVASADQGAAVWGKVIEKHWNGQRSWDADSDKEESFSLLVEQGHGEIGIVYVSPLVYKASEVNGQIRLSP
jgi:hypothetical protein